MANSLADGQNTHMLCVARLIAQISKGNAMNASRGRSRNRVKNRAVSARCGRGSRGLGFVLVALWGNGATPSVLKCHETGAILCGYGLVGNFQTRETSEFQAQGLSDQRQARHGKPIAITQGHPDASGQHVCDTLADEYSKGTEDGGYEVKRIDVARLDFPILRTKGEFEKSAPPITWTCAGGHQLG